MKHSILGAACAGILTLVSTSSHAALIPIGDGLVYDEEQDITWSHPGDGNDNYLTWWQARDWAAGLSLGGANDWRLPSIDELHALYFSGVTYSTPEPFPLLQPDAYWSGTEYDSNRAWILDVRDGVQYVGHKNNDYFMAWAVHAGNVGASAVPVPAAAWLFGSGLLGLVGTAQRKRMA